MHTQTIITQVQPIKYCIRIEYNYSENYICIVGTYTVTPNNNK